MDDLEKNEAPENPAQNEPEKKSRKKQPEPQPEPSGEDPFRLMPIFIPPSPDPNDTSPYVLNVNDHIFMIPRGVKSEVPYYAMKHYEECMAQEMSVRKLIQGLGQTVENNKQLFG